MVWDDDGKTFFIRILCGLSRVGLEWVNYLLYFKFLL